MPCSGWAREAAEPPPGTQQLLSFPSREPREEEAPPSLPACLPAFPPASGGGVGGRRWRLIFVLTDSEPPSPRSVGRFRTCFGIEFLSLLDCSPWSFPPVFIERSFMGMQPLASRCSEGEGETGQMGKVRAPKVGNHPTRSQRGLPREGLVKWLTSLLLLHPGSSWKGDI